MLINEFEKFKFNDNNQKMTKEVKGIQVPKDYYEFMMIHNGNGGTGEFGKNSYIQLLNMDELDEYNEMYEIQKWYPNCFAFGTDLGGNHFVYNIVSKKYCSVDSCSDYEDRMYEEDLFEEFLLRWDKELEEI